MSKFRYITFWSQFEDFFWKIIYEKNTFKTIFFVIKSERKMFGHQADEKKSEKFNIYRQIRRIFIRNLLEKIHFIFIVNCLSLHVFHKSEPQIKFLPARWNIILVKLKNQFSINLEWSYGFYSKHSFYSKHQWNHD